MLVGCGYEDKRQVLIAQNVLVANFKPRIGHYGHFMFDFINNILIYSTEMRWDCSIYLLIIYGSSICFGISYISVKWHIII